MQTQPPNCMTQDNEMFSFPLLIISPSGGRPTLSIFPDESSRLDDTTAVSLRRVKCFASYKALRVEGLDGLPSSEFESVTRGRFHADRFVGDIASAAFDTVVD